MTSKSASAALADGSALSSRSREASAALACSENPRMRGSAGRGALCADTHAEASDAAPQATSTTNRRRMKLTCFLLTLERHFLERRDPRGHRRMRRGQGGPKPRLDRKSKRP